MPLDQPPSASEKLGADLRMSFGEHIEDLRRRLIYALLGVVVAAVVTFAFGFQIIAWLTQPFVQALAAMGYPAQTYVRDPTLGFGIYVKVSLVAAIVVAAPWVIYQIWRFVVEGLYPNERRAAYLLAPFSTLMSVLAVLFTRYVLLPVSLLFFIRFATFYPEVEPAEPGWLMQAMIGDDAPPEAPILTPDDGPAAEPMTVPVLAADPAAPVEGSLWINGPQSRLKAFFHGRVQVLSVTSSRIITPLPELGDYIGFATLVGLGNVAAFQLPVVMLVIGWTNLVDPAVVRGLRKYAFFACALIAAALTPADIVSMSILLIPLYGLFELGLLLMRLTHKADEPWAGDDAADGP